MPRKNKPGPRLKKPKRWPVTCLAMGDEDEYIARKAFDTGLTKSQALLARFLSEGWMQELLFLREKQKGLPFKFRREA